MRERYFDNAATTPLDPRVLEEMLPFLSEEFGNANSIHGFGARAMTAIDLARERVATLLGADDPGQIVFTSGATEANNWVINAHTDGVFSPFEHSAVREPATRRGMEPLQNDGPKLLAPSRYVEFLSVMSLNNETGSLWRPQDFREHADVLHSDLTQQVGKMPIEMEDLDYASLSAHKIYGPKGVGALYFATTAPHPFQVGGEQEHGLRAGTLNVPGIVGLGAACAIAQQEMEKDFEHAQKLRNIVLEELLEVPECQLNGGENTAPYILSISFRKVEGETLVIEADGAGYAISAGAACSSRSTEPSHVLSALGLKEEWLRGTVRISFGRFNSVDSARYLAKTLKHSVEKLRRMF